MSSVLFQRRFRQEIDEIRLILDEANAQTELQAILSNNHPQKSRKITEFTVCSSGVKTSTR